MKKECRTNKEEFEAHEKVQCYNCDSKLSCLVNGETRSQELTCALRRYTTIVNKMRKQGLNHDEHL